LLEKCKLSRHFPNVSEDDAAMHEAVKQALCLNTDQKLHIGGPPGQKGYSTSVISLERCDERSEKKHSIKCKSASEIADYMN
jgi:hypothetical protein